MAYQTGTAYHADSDADDEYERSVMTSPTQLHTDSENSPTDSEPPSNEHTPTTFGNAGEDQALPRSIITEWTADECAQFVASLGLRQYCDAFIGEQACTFDATLRDKVADDVFQKMK
jgi:protein STE50